jgi:hypothetical protein
MKIIKWSEINEEQGPFYDILRDDASPYSDDPRQLGCAPKSILNLINLLEAQRGTTPNQSNQEIGEELVRELKQSEELSVNIMDISEFIDRSPFFNGTRVFCFNFKATAPDIGQSILLRRLLSGQVALLFIEMPDWDQETPNKATNHLAVLHSDGEDVFLDGLKVDWETLLHIVYYSPVNMAWIFGLDPKSVEAP